MSDTDKPTPESPDAGTSEATAPAANVISIEQARAELLRKPRSRTPPRGTSSPAPRSRGREVPSPVTLPPGEHSAVIVTDTPAARAHIDKKTVHPGEAPAETHEKKVRVKTHLDPRRAKTQVTDRRATPPNLPDVTAMDRATPSYAPNAGSPEAASMFTSQAPSQPPVQPTSQPPPAHLGAQRPSLVRPRPTTHEHSSAPLFLVGVAVAAALGAVLVYMLSRQKTEPVGPPPTGTPALTAVLNAPSGSPSASAPLTASVPATATSTEPAATVTQTAELPSSSVPATPVKTGHSVAPHPSTTATTAPTATAKPTATSILPFGKEEP